MKRVFINLIAIYRESTANSQLGIARFGVEICITQRSSEEQHHRAHATISVKVLIDFCDFGNYTEPNLGCCVW
jgi:hypothetical protein